LLLYLLGAAVDNDIVDANTPLGQVITRQVDAFVNLYSSNDYVLTTVYWAAEANPGLGRGTMAGITLPPNYRDINVQQEIRPINDANGDGTKDFLVPDVKVGENHFGFPGFRWESGTLRDDGSMNVVVNNWMVQGHTPPPSPVSDTRVTFLSATFVDSTNPSHEARARFNFGANSIGVWYPSLGGNIPMTSGTPVTFPDGTSVDVIKGDKLQVTATYNDLNLRIGGLVAAPLRIVVSESFTSADNFGEGQHTASSRSPITGIDGEGESHSISLTITYRVDPINP
jgi:hypothetical protein